MRFFGQFKYVADPFSVATTDPAKCDTIFRISHILNIKDYESFIVAKSGSGRFECIVLVSGRVKAI